MLNHRAALKDLGDESLTGIVDIFVGEKDPRNLMVVFSILKVVIIEWKIAGHAEVSISANGVTTGYLLITDSL